MKNEEERKENKIEKIVIGVEKKASDALTLLIPIKDQGNDEPLQKLKKSSNRCVKKQKIQTPRSIRSSQKDP